MDVKDGLNDVEQEYINTIIEENDNLKLRRFEIEKYVSRLGKIPKELRKIIDGNDLVKYTDKQINAINGLYEALMNQQEGVEGSEYSVLAYTKVLEDLGFTSDEIKSIIDSLNTSIGDTETTTEDTRMSMEDFRGEVKSATEDVDLLATAERELQEEGKLSQKTLDALMDRYSDFGKILGWSKEEMINPMVQSGNFNDNDALIAAQKSASSQALSIRTQAISSTMAEIEKYENQLGYLQATKSNLIDAGTSDPPSRSGSSSSGSSSAPQTEEERIAQAQKESFEKTEQALYSYKQELADYQNQLEHLRIERNMMEEGSQEYISSINKENDLLEEQRKANQRYRDAIKNSIKTENLSDEKKRELSDVRS